MTYRVVTTTWGAPQSRRRRLVPNSNRPLVVEMSSLRLSASARAATSALAARRTLHHSAVRAAITSFRMPAMSPTMTEGGVHSWKVKEGDSFSAGDVLLEIVRCGSIFK